MTNNHTTCTACQSPTCTLLDSPIGQLCIACYSAAVRHGDIRTDLQSTTHAVGTITTTDHSLCLACAALPELSFYGVGSPDQPITDPAPSGLYRPGQNSDRYDAACSVCGWAIRRQVTR